MKPDKVTCNNCGIQILKGKWCSDKCRMAFSRNPNKPEQKGEQIQPEPEQNEQPEQNISISRTNLTATDKTFYDRAMKDFNEPYYNFNSSERTLKCAYCGKEYTTCLSLNRYCCYEHYKTAITTVK